MHVKLNNFYFNLKSLEYLSKITDKDWASKKPEERKTNDDALLMRNCHIICYTKFASLSLNLFL
jgi:hypothetical protein